MNIKDIVELAKAGYKPNEVKELMKMAEQQNHDESEQNHDESEQNHDESNEISKLNKKIAELERGLKVAQEHNRRSGGNQHEELAPEDYLKDVMRNFY